MKLHITRVQEFRNSPTDPPVYEVTGDIPSGFGPPEISVDYELSPVGAAPAGEHKREDSRSPVAAAPAPVSPSPVAGKPGAENVTRPRFLGKPGELLVRCHPIKIYKSGKRLVVAYEEARQEGAHLKAYDRYLACWQEKLFEAVKATQGQDAEFGCIEVAKNGTKFVNIVGVRIRTEVTRA